MGKSVISYGAYIPYQRITREEYINFLGRCGAEIKEKAVMDVDEDVITMAVEAAKNAVAEIDISQIGVLALASTNFPYQEKAMAGTLIDVLGLKDYVLTSQHSNSTLAGTEAFLAALSMLDHAEGKYALVVVSDAPAAYLFDNVEHGFGAAACAFVIAKGVPGLEFKGTYSCSRDSLGLRYRRPGDIRVRDIGVRKYSTDIYSKMVKSSILGLVNKMQKNISDYQHVIFQQFSVRDTIKLAKKIGLNDDQVKSGLIFAQVGDTGACSSLLALCKVLDSASVGEEILLCAYGTGAGAHSLSFILNELPKKQKSFESLLNDKAYISFIDYLKLKKHI